LKNQIVQLRARCGWSQAELAERLNVSRQTVNSLERGRYDPSLPLAFRIASLFECKIEDVFIADEKSGLARPD
jgi:putative transcriptional regulator